MLTSSKISDLNVYILYFNQEDGVLGFWGFGVLGLGFRV
jgi:hypothetical protein